MVKDSELYNALYICTEKIIDLLCEEGFYTDGKWSLDIKNHPVFDKIPELEDASLLIDMLISKGIIKKPEFVDNEGNRVENPSKKIINHSGLLHAGILKFIMEYMGNTQSLKIDKEIFDSRYDDFEKYSIDRIVNICSITPILNFSSDIDMIEFDNDTKIIRLDNNEINYLKSNLSDREQIFKDINSESIDKIFSSGFALRIDLSLKKDDITSAEQMIGDKRRHVLNTLRLLKPGDPILNITFDRYKGFHHAFITNSPSCGYEYTHPLIPDMKEGFHFASGNEDACRQLWYDIQKLSSIEDQGGLDIPVRKFNDLYNRKFLEDKILDMAILLDSILLYKEKSAAYRFSQRGTRLRMKDPQKTFILLKKFYNLRSDIIHEGERLRQNIIIYNKNNKKVYEYSPSYFVLEIENICRDIIRILINDVTKGSSIANIFENLEEDLLTNKNYLQKWREKMLRKKGYI